ncbi:hypothetical protein NMY22_g11150 [Coprinellus aureogranulatus]|nr:hypothetical protein NMY22_g11150 [Coprinellus aureogranulatus]
MASSSKNDARVRDLPLSSSMRSLLGAVLSLTDRRILLSVRLGFGPTKRTVQWFRRLARPASVQAVQVVHVDSYLKTLYRSPGGTSPHTSPAQNVLQQCRNEDERPVGMLNKPLNVTFARPSPSVRLYDSILLRRLPKSVPDQGDDVVFGAMIVKLFYVNIVRHCGRPYVLFNATGNEKSKGKTGVSLEEIDNVLEQFGDIEPIFALIESVQDEKKWGSRQPRSPGLQQWLKDQDFELIDNGHPCQSGSFQAAWTSGAVAGNVELIWNARVTARRAILLLSPDPRKKKKLPSSVPASLHSSATAWEIADFPHPTGPQSQRIRVLGAILRRKSHSSKDRGSSSGRCGLDTQVIHDLTFSRTTRRVPGRQFELGGDLRRLRV